MDMKPIVETNPLLAVMRKVPLERTLDYAQAVYDAGVKFFEVALNSPDGLKQIAMLAKHFDGKAMVGAGTAISADLARSALDAGAMFLLAPSSPVDVLELCADGQVYFLPGVLTPSDINMCISFGFTTLKMFPAGDMPMGYVKSLQGPFDQTNYIAMGGVTPDNAAEFIRAGYIGVGLGSNLVPKELAEQGKWQEVTKRIASLLQSVQAAVAK